MKRQYTNEINALHHKASFLVDPDNKLYINMKSSGIYDMKSYLNGASENGIITTNGSDLYKLIVEIPGFDEHIINEFPDEFETIVNIITGFHVFLAMRYACITNNDKLLISIYEYILTNIPKHGQWHN